MPIEKANPTHKNQHEQQRKPKSLHHTDKKSRNIEVDSKRFIDLTDAFVHSVFLNP